MTAKDLIDVLTLAVGLCSAIGGGLAWYRSSVRKSYAAEKDFSIINQKLTGLSTKIEKYQEELNLLENEVIKTKTVLKVLLQKEGIAESPTQIRDKNRDK